MTSSILLFIRPLNCLFANAEQQPSTFVHPTSSGAAIELHGVVVEEILENAFPSFGKFHFLCRLRQSIWNTPMGMAGIIFVHGRRTSSTSKEEELKGTSAPLRLSSSIMKWVQNVNANNNVALMFRQIEGPLLLPLWSAVPICSFSMHCMYLIMLLPLFVERERCGQGPFCGYSLNCMSSV